MTKYRRRAPIADVEASWAEMSRSIWLLLVKQECRVTAREIGEEVGAHASKLLRLMSQRGQIHQLPVDSIANPYTYAVTPRCRIPRSVTVADVLEAVVPEKLTAAITGHFDSGVTTYRRYCPVPGSLPWRVCKYFADRPDETLTRTQLRSLFDIPEVQGIEGNIVQAVVCGAIREVREPGKGKRLRWAKGPSTNVILLDLPTATDEIQIEERVMANNPFGLAAEPSK